MTQDLIRIVPAAINGEAVRTVNARELHAFLEVGKMFAHWIKERIEQYGFSEGLDYVVFAQTGKNPQGGRPSTEYALTLDMAKELCMVERNDRGKEARQYFIECEKRMSQSLYSGLMDFLANPDSLRGLLGNYAERVLALEAKLKEQAPAVAFHDRVAQAINAKSIQEVAKVLGVGPNKLFAYLRENDLLMWNNLPYQKHIDAGYFRVIERQFNDKHGESQTYARTLVTGKGMTYLAKRLSADSLKLVDAQGGVQ